MIVLVILSFSSASYAILDEPPSLALVFKQGPRVVGFGCPGVYSFDLYPTANFYGKVNLSTVILPKGVVATFAPNPVEIKKDQFGGNTNLQVSVTSPDVPHFNYSVYFEAKPLSGSNFNNTYSNNTLVASQYLVLNISSCEQPQNATTQLAPITITSTTILSTTLTSTITTTSIERVTYSSIYAWAIVATATAAVLAIILLRKKG